MARRDRARVLDAGHRRTRASSPDGELTSGPARNPLPLPSSMGALVGEIFAAGQLEALADWARGLQQRDVLRSVDPTLRDPGVMRAERVLDRARRSSGCSLVWRCRRPAGRRPPQFRRHRAQVAASVEAVEDHLARVAVLAALVVDVGLEPSSRGSPSSSAVSSHGPSGPCVSNDLPARPCSPAGSRPAASARRRRVRRRKSPAEASPQNMPCGQPPVRARCSRFDGTGASLQSSSARQGSKLRHNAMSWRRVRGGGVIGGPAFSRACRRGRHSSARSSP